MAIGVLNILSALFCVAQCLLVRALKGALSKDRCVEIASFP